MMEYLNMNIRISPRDIEDIICKNQSYIRYDWKLAENTLFFLQNLYLSVSASESG